MSKTYFCKVLKKFANLNFAIFILFIIIIFCILGSIIEQDKDLAYYEFTYSFYKDLILFLGIDHIFHTWWFTLLLILLIVSLCACTFSTQLPSLKNARRWKFIYHKDIVEDSNIFSARIHNLELCYTNFIYSLLRLNFFVFYKTNSVYSYKGLYGRIAPVFVHFSIILILLGSLISLFFGFVVQEFVPEGEIFHLKNIVHSGPYSYLPSHFSYSVNNFFIDYNINGSIQQFFSLLSISSKDHNSVIAKLISVNNPLSFNSIVFYQTDWQINALRVNLGYNNIVQQNLLKTTINNKNCWLSTIPISNNRQIFFVVFNLNNDVFVFNDNGFLLGKVNVGEVFYLNNIPTCIHDIITSTGLQIKIDPGISSVYFGFFVMILSTFVSYLSYSQIWIYSNFKFFNLIGSTNRASLFFEQDISYLKKIYYYYDSYLLNYECYSPDILL